MPFAAALSRAPQAVQALDEVCLATRAGLGGPPDLAVLFFSAHHAGAAGQLARAAGQQLAPRALIGCVAETVVAQDQEVEQGPALALWLARWSGAVTLTPFHLVLEGTADGPSLIGWPDPLVELIGRPADPTSPTRQRGDSVLVLGDPFTFPTDLFLGRMNEDLPGLPVLGGMASGMRGPGQCRLLLGGEVHDRGAVGVLLQGEVGLRWIVSQGCRPVGRPLVVTRAEQNVIFELGGRTPLEQLQEMWEGLSSEDQELVRAGLHLGVVINEYQERFDRGDFLIRNLQGLDGNSGALIVADEVRVGQTVQFHVRDAATADEDLRALLGQARAGGRPAASGLLFSCNGRGTRLFDQPNHDAGAIRQELGPIPLAGLFAQGELGPVGGQNFIHGYTASLALFEE
jgi:small ligand-binding sensory domain FIST